MADIPPYRDDVLASLLLRAKNDGSTGSAQDAFLRRIREPVLLFLRGRLADPRLAPFVDDVVAEVMVRIFRHFRKCEATTDREVVAWALKIAHNEALRLLRKHPFRYALLLGDDDPANFGPKYSSGKWRFPTFGTYVPSQDEALSSEGMVELLRVLETAESSMDPTLQRLLYLRLLEDATWFEVGASLKISAAAAKRRFQRAQAALAKKVKEGIDQLPAAKRDAAYKLLRRFERY